MRRSKRKTIFAGVMSVAIIAQGMGAGILPVEANEQKKVKTITAVEELDEKVLHQEVEFGTSEAQLIFPKRLKATVLIDEEENIPVASPSDAEAVQTASPSDAEDVDYEEDNGEEQETVSVPIKWELNERFSASEEYDGEIAGIYVFDAALKNEERYQLDTELPRIEITVSSPQEMALIQNVQSDVVSGDGWTLDLDTNLLTIKNNEGQDDWKKQDSSQYTVKEVIFEDDVTSVASTLFYENSTIETVILGDGVKEIETLAFYNCSSLKNIEFGNQLEVIGLAAFRDCTSLEHVDLGENIHTISRNAFNGCSALETVELNDKLETIGDYAFANCKTLNKLDLEGSLKKIGSFAFSGCDGLRSVVIGSTVEEIGEFAFNSCDALVDVSIGENVKTIGGYAFAFTNIKNIEIGKGVESIGDAVFQSCDQLETVKIATKEISERMFSNCSSLKEIIIDDNTEIIRNSAFYNCISLIEFSTGDGVKTIEADAFWNCNNLRTITFGKNIASIENTIFSGCYQLSNFIFAKKVPPEFSQGAFLTINGPQDNIAYVPFGTMADYEEALQTSGRHFSILELPCEHENLSEYKSDETNHWKECLECKVIVGKAPHHGGTATETEQAICEVCGVHYGELAKPCEHTNLSEYQFDEFNHWRVCLECGRIVGKENHHGGIATEQEKAICEICGASYGELVPSAPEPNDPSNPSEPSDSGTASSGTRRSDSDRSTTSNQFTAGVDGKWRFVENRPMTWQFIRNNGTMLWNMWAYIDNPYAVDGQPHAGWFYFDQDGIMQYDWYRNVESGKWYYLHSESDGMLGTMEEGWHYENRDGNWYYMKPGTGEMATGWQCINGKWYYFNVNVDHDTWYYDDGKNQWIYHENAGKPYGAMYCDEITPDGYKVDENGAWIAQ